MSKPLRLILLPAIVSTVCMYIGVHLGQWVRALVER